MLLIQRQNNLEILKMEIKVSKINNDNKNIDLPKPKKRRTKKIFLLIFILLILGTLSYFGLKVYIAAKKIIGTNTSGGAPGILGILNPSQLKGEGSGRINILLLGIGGEGWPGGQLTDTIMVVSIDPKNKDVAMLSIPRDLYVKVPDNGYTKINAAHAYAEDKKEGSGPEISKDTISSVLDIPIHYFARVDFSGFEKIIDILGGITVNVEEDLYDPFFPNEDNTAYNPFYIEKGVHEMDGKTALKYARSRETTSDFDRAKRQQKILLATREKALSLETLINPTKISETIDLLEDHIKTDIQIWEMGKLAEISKEIKEDHVISKVIDGGFLFSDMVDGMYVLKPKNEDYEDIQGFVHSIFTDAYLSEERATIEISNGTENNGLAYRAGKLLNLYNYYVVKVGDAQNQSQNKTLIYDYTDGKKPYTISYLENRFGVKAEKIRGKENQTDIKIIVGYDYKE